MLKLCRLDGKALNHCESKMNLSSEHLPLVRQIYMYQLGQTFKFSKAIHKAQSHHFATSCFQIMFIKFKLKKKKTSENYKRKP